MSIHRRGENYYIDFRFKGQRTRETPALAFEVGTKWPCVPNLCPESIIGIFPKKRFCQAPFSVLAWDPHQDIPKEKNHGQINFSASS